MACASCWLTLGVVPGLDAVVTASCLPLRSNSSTSEICNPFALGSRNPVKVKRYVSLSSHELGSSTGVAPRGKSPVYCAIRAVGADSSVPDPITPQPQTVFPSTFHDTGSRLSTSFAVKRRRLVATLLLSASVSSNTD
eukprot:scaffold9941_cov42-Phaeocystis_antarctica.AAC.5